MRIKTIRQSVTFKASGHELKKTERITELIFTQTDVPDSEFDMVNKGWHKYYWDPIRKMLRKKDRSGRYYLE